MEPYRGHTRESPCHQCERPTTLLCTCCNRPVCTKHREHQICGHCDEALYIHMKRHDGSNGMFIGLFGSVILLCVGAFSIQPLIWIGMFGLIAGPFIGIALHKRRTRAKFFARVRKTGALPSKDAGESHPELRRLKAFVEEVNQRPKG